MSKSNTVVAALAPERQDHFRRLQRAVAQRREEERQAHEALLDARVVIGALQTQLAKLWDETVAEHSLCRDRRYTFRDDGGIVEIPPERAGD